ncbi:MAG: DUF2927 domain-containing protein, partial [Paracoccaceae bacterium]
GAGASIQLRRNDGAKRPDIQIVPVALREGQRTRATPRMPDGDRIGAGHMRVWWDGRNRIFEGSIVIAADIAEDQIDSVVLEEVFQALGFLYDVKDPHYEGRSILAQDSSTTVRLQGQDRMLLLRSYPPL